MKRIAIVDIDGVIADHRHREHYIKDKKSKEQDWEKFYSEMGKDLVHKDMYELLMALYGDSWFIYLLTGREETYMNKKVTIEWLKENEVLYDKLFMRTEKDYRADHVVKDDYVKEIIKEKHHDGKLIIAFDDREQNIKMFRNNNITCFHTFINKPSD